MVQRFMRYPSLLIDVFLSDDKLIAFLEKERDRDCDNNDYWENECDDVVSDHPTLLVNNHTRIRARRHLDYSCVTTPCCLLDCTESRPYVAGIALQLRKIQGIEFELHQQFLDYLRHESVIHCEVQLGQAGRYNAKKGTSRVFVILPKEIIVNVGQVAFVGRLLICIIVVTSTKVINVPFFPF